MPLRKCAVPFFANTTIWLTPYLYVTILKYFSNFSKGDFVLLIRYFIVFVLFNVEMLCYSATIYYSTHTQDKTVAVETEADDTDDEKAVIEVKDTDVVSQQTLADNDAVNAAANARRGAAEKARQESEKAVYDEKAHETEEAARIAEEQRIAAMEQAEYDSIAAQPENVPYTAEFCRADAFSYERASAITSTGSDQYKLVHSDAVTISENGYLMKGDRHLVAVGTRYADHVGDDIDIMYEDGTLLRATVGDFKSDRHTDPTHSYHYGWTDENGFHQADGSVVEFLVGWDKPGNPPDAVRTGNKAVKVYPAPKTDSLIPTGKPVGLSEKTAQSE